MNKKNNVSWVGVGMALFFLPPLGVFLLIKKLSGDRRESFSVSAPTGTMGVGLIVAGVVFMAVLPGFGTMMIFAAVGVLVYRSYLRARSERFRSHINAIINNGERSIKSVAKSAGCTYDRALSDLEEMVREGILSDASIDRDSGEIRLKNQTPWAYTPEPAAGKHPQSQRRQVIVTCKSCGANHILFESEVKRCEYCDTPISA